jgi:hypothetical protein
MAEHNGTPANHALPATLRLAYALPVPYLCRIAQMNHALPMHKTLITSEVKPLLRGSVLMCAKANRSPRLACWKVSAIALHNQMRMTFDSDHVHLKVNHSHFLPALVATEQRYKNVPYNQGKELCRR